MKPHVANEREYLWTEPTINKPREPARPSIKFPSRNG